MEYEPIIGLEVHVELKTKSKMFCGCPADHFGKEPNTQTCPVCLGLPGALPVPNKKAVEWAILLGLALNCQINRQSRFDRKHYFYPDLPKGYQISQYDEPIAIGGWLKLKVKSEKLKVDEEKIIRVRRVHLEEDTGKLLHSNQIPNYDGPDDASLIDFNRGGVPLVEIVTEPDFRTSEEAKEFLKKIQLIVRYLGISDCDMEKGSLRIEPSISLRRLPESGSARRADSGSLESEYPNYRVEIKNINSFKFAQRAIDYEIQRQSERLKRGEKVIQETRGFNEAKRQTIGQRTKEEAHDYRYFPEPDIPPMQWEQLTIDKLQLTIPELPDAKIERYVKQFRLKGADAKIIAGDVATADYFEEAVAVGVKDGILPAKIANALVNKRVNTAKVSPIQLIISLKPPSDQRQIKTEEIHEAINQVLKANPKAIKDYKSGRTSALQFLLGLVIKNLQGRADPQVVRRALEEVLL